MKSLHKAYDESINSSISQKLFCFVNWCLYRLICTWYRAVKQKSAKVIHKLRNVKLWNLENKKVLIPIK